MPESAAWLRPPAAIAVPKLVAKSCLTCTVVLLAGVSLLLASLPALAAADPTRLGITAMDQKTIFFDLLMRPGEKRALSAILTNGSTEPIKALTYAADVYTIVNGGFGVVLRGQPATGTTTWLDYPTDSVQLQPAESLRRDFTVTVPADASPGDYITSLVLENQDPIQGSGGIVLNQVVRHALAVAIDIPGPRLPALHVTSASHSVVAGRSIVSIAVENPGNAQLKPVGELHLFEASGREVSHSPITMDSFYAKTPTHVEVALGGRLRPGHYVAVVVLADPGVGLSLTSDRLPFEVASSPVQPGSPVGSVPGSAPGQRALGGGIPIWLFAASIAAAVLAGVIAARLIPVLWRRRADRAIAKRGA
jgi:hypothetical protein